jgi:nucleoside transporter
MSKSMFVRLWLMVFLQYCIWSMWYVTMGTYLNSTLGFSGAQIGLAYGTTAIGAMISPFFVGMIADRFFATERILAVLHLLGSALLFFVSTRTTFSHFYPCLIMYTLCYMATLSLTNSLSLHQMKNPSKEFPAVMFMGSVGWIVGGLIIGQLKIETSAAQFQIASGASLVLALYSLTMPHTPPTNAGKPLTAAGILGLDALKLMKSRSFATFAVGSFCICIPLSFYFSWTNVFLNEIGVTNAASKMTLGQVSDVLFLLLMPFFTARLGIKKMLLLGMLAWAVRFTLFTLFAEQRSSNGLLYAGILLHGICYDYFFVMGRIYVDKRSPIEMRATAQGFIAFVTLGAGMFIGTWLSGVVGQAYAYMDETGTAIHQWSKIWMIPAGLAALVLVAFGLLFKDEGTEIPSISASRQTTSPTQETPALNTIS